MKTIVRKSLLALVAVAMCATTIAAENNKSFWKAVVDFDANTKLATYKKFLSDHATQEKLTWDEYHELERLVPEANEVSVALTLLCPSQGDGNDLEKKLEKQYAVAATSLENLLYNHTGTFTPLASWVHQNPGKTKVISGVTVVVVGGVVYYYNRDAINNGCKKGWKKLTDWYKKPSASESVKQQLKAEKAEHLKAKLTVNDLENKLSDAQQAADLAQKATQNQATDFSSKLSDVQQANERLEAARKAEEAARLAAQNEITGLSDKLNDVQKAKDALESARKAEEVARLAAENKATGFLDKLNVVQKAKEKLEFALKAAKEKEAQLLQQLADAKQAKNADTAQITSLRDQLAKLKERLAQLTKQVAKLTSENEAMKEAARQVTQNLDAIDLEITP